MAEVLIVDTDNNDTKEISGIIKSSKFGYLQIYTATTAERAIMLLKQKSPNVLILDVSLPDMDGIKLGKTALQLYPDLPVIIITQLRMFEIAQASINSGFVGYLLKPVIGSELISILKRVLTSSINQEINRSLDDEFNIDLRNPAKSAVQYIQIHYRNQISLKEISEKVYLSPSYFSKLFKDEIGMTFVEYLSWIRIQKAKEMLRMSSLPMDVIANRSGFSNSSYFATTFRKIEGKTPTQYREKFNY